MGISVARLAGAAAHPASETRSFSAAISETGVLAFVGLFMLFMPFVLIGTVEGVEVAFKSASTAGKLLVDHVGWALTGNVTVLLGFYLVVIGGQILDGGDAARTRRVLAVVAESMAAASVGILALIVVHCIDSPDSRGVLVAVLPMVLILLFLAAQLGRFLILDREQRLAAALLARDDARRRLVTVDVRSRLPFLLVSTASAAVSAVAGTVTIVLVGLPWATRGAPVPALATTAVFFFLLAVGLLGWTVFAVYMAEEDSRLFSRIVFIVLSVVVYGVVAAAAVNLIVSDANGAVGWGMVATASATLVLAVCPPLGKRLLINWSFRAAIQTLLARRLVRSYARSVREIVELRAAPEDTEGSVLQRIRARFRGSPAGRNDAAV